MRFDLANGRLEFLEDRVVLTRRFQSTRSKFNTFLRYASIRELRLVPATRFRSGFIQFSQEGSPPHKSRFYAVFDPNCLIFKWRHQEMAYRAADFACMKIEEAQAAYEISSQGKSEESAPVREEVLEPENAVRGTKDEQKKIRLTPCPACKARISTAATACPKCGHPLPTGWAPVSDNTTKVGLGCMATFAIFVAILILVGMHSGTQTRYSAAGYRLFPLKGKGRMVPACPTVTMLNKIVDAIADNDKTLFALMLFDGCRQIPGGTDVELLKFVGGQPFVRFHDKDGLPGDGVVQFQMLKQ